MPLFSYCLNEEGSNWHLGGILKGEKPLSLSAHEQKIPHEPKSFPNIAIE